MGEKKAKVGSRMLTVIDIPIDKIKPNPWNPNVQDDATFNRLCIEIQQTGFIDPIQVVAMEDGTYRVIGGEHRYEACKVLGMNEIPCVVLTDEKWKDEDFQKFVTVRLNVLKGDIDAEKFIKLYQDLAKRYKQEELQNLFAISDESVWRKLTASISKGLKQMGMSPELVKKFDETVKELKTIDDLSLILNSLFTEYGKDLKMNFMIFSWGGKKLLYVQANDEVFKRVESFVEDVRKAGIDINVPLLKIFAEAKIEIPDGETTFDEQVDVEP